MAFGSEPKADILLVESGTPIHSFEHTAHIRAVVTVFPCFPDERKKWIMLWLICLCLLVVSEVGAVRVDEDCLVQDRLFMRRHKPESAAFFAYVQHNGSIFTASILCNTPNEFYFLHVTSQDIAWEERIKHSIKRRKSPNSKEGWMSFTYHTDTHQLSDNEGRFWNDKEVLKDCSFLNISVRDGLLAQRMCDDGPKWLVTEDRCADVHLPLTSGKTLSINLSSNDSFIPLFESRRFTAKLVRVEGELALVEDESCPGCQPLQGERNVLRLPLSASNQKIAKPFPRAVRVCSSTGKSFTVSVSQTQEALETVTFTAIYYVAIILAIMLVFILALVAITRYCHRRKNKPPDSSVEEERGTRLAAGCADEPGRPTFYRYLDYINPLFYPRLVHQPLPYPVFLGENLGPLGNDMTLESGSCSCQSMRRRSHLSPNLPQTTGEAWQDPNPDSNLNPCQSIPAVNPAHVLLHPTSRQSFPASRNHYATTLPRRVFEEADYDEMVPLANVRPPSKSFALGDPNCCETLNSLYETADSLTQPGTTPSLPLRPSPLLPSGRRPQPLPQEGRASPPPASRDSLLPGD